MELIIEAFNYLLASIMIGVGGAWIFLIKSMTSSFRHAPYLDRFEDTCESSPMVSIILPARNEEKFIGRCLDSLIDQEYKNYEIIVIDDSSEDSTPDIVSEYAEKNPQITHVRADPKPEGWMGKNWACMEGYRKAQGDLLLFTDADTVHSRNVVSLAVANLVSSNLDALSVIPRMRTFDFWTRVTLPMISMFLHTRFSALNVNDPKKKTGYFFGSFFILKRETYIGVGMHEGVKHEIIEDGVLGKKVKESGYSMRMVRGEHLIDAVWARDRTTLWDALKRPMVPLYLHSKKVAVGIFFAVAFLLFVPFPVLVASALLQIGTASADVLFAAAVVASTMIYIGGAIEVRSGLGLRLVYAAFAPLGSLVVVTGFLSGLYQANDTAAVAWRGRVYSMKGYSQDIRI